jgi:hypothetical protein
MFSKAVIISALVAVAVAAPFNIPRIGTVQPGAVWQPEGETNQNNARQ